jgi:hypothetical protein
MTVGKTVGIYQDGWEHGLACIKAGRPTDYQAIANWADTDPFFAGYRDAMSHRECFR